MHFLIQFSFFLFLILAFASCSGSTSVKEGESNLIDQEIIQEDEDEDPVMDPPVVEKVTMTASRHYHPSHWENDERVADFSGDYYFPQTEIEVLSGGNSGTGWLSLAIGSLKFCYQGNASNNQTANGDRFILAKVFDSVEPACHSAVPTIDIPIFVTITKGDEIRLSIPGGGCSGSACKSTTVEVHLTLR